MRKRLLILLLTALLVGVAVPAASDAGIRITLNGQPLALDVAPVMVDGRTLVPMRAIFEALGAEVLWDAASQTVGGRLGAHMMGLQIGSHQALVNGRPIDLDVPARIIAGRTLVPVRFISESLGAQVAWDGETRTVAITTAAPGGTPGTADDGWTTKPVACDGGLFDTHAHTGGEGFGLGNLTIPALAAQMRAQDVRCAVLFVLTTDVQHRYDGLRADLSSPGVGFVPFLQPVPVFPYTADDITRILAERPQVFVGIGEIPFYIGTMVGTSLKAEPWPTLFAYAGKNNRFLMLHPTGWQATEIADMLSRYPETKVIMHGPELLMAGDLLAKLLRDHQNLYWTMDVAGLLEGRMVRERNAADFVRWYDANYQRYLAQGRDYLLSLLAAAPDRVMWGTDVGGAWNIEPEAYSRIIGFTRSLIDLLPAAHRDPFAFANAKRIFGNGIIFAPTGP